MVVSESCMNYYLLLTNRLKFNTNFLKEDKGTSLQLSCCDLAIATSA